MRTRNRVDIVSPAEIEKAVMEMLASKFEGRVVTIAVLDLGLNFALASLRRLATQEAKRKGTK
jgi:hypothetical protein